MRKLLELYIFFSPRGLGVCPCYHLWLRGRHSLSTAASVGSQGKSGMVHPNIGVKAGLEPQRYWVGEELEN